jgi:hypothetical protein
LGSKSSITKKKKKKKNPENQLVQLLPVITLQLSSKNWKFGKLLSANVILKAPQYFHDTDADISNKM